MKSGKQYERRSIRSRNAAFSHPFFPPVPSLPLASMLTTLPQAEWKRTALQAAPCAGGARVEGTTDPAGASGRSTRMLPIDLEGDGLPKVKGVQQVDSRSSTTPSSAGQLQVVPPRQPVDARRHTAAWSREIKGSHWDPLESSGKLPETGRGPPTRTLNDVGQSSLVPRRSHDGA